MAHTVEEDAPRRSRGFALRERLKGAAARARAGRSRRGGAQDEEHTGRREPVWDDFDAAMGEPDQEAWPPPPGEAQPEPVAEPEAAPAPAPQAAPGADAKPEPAEEPEKRPRDRKPAKPRAKRQARPRATAKPESAPAPERATTRKAKRGPEALMRRAVERFNSSEERRKVAGLIRSLGEPNAGVQPDQRRQLALVTIAWELSWYQWEVGADGDGDDGEPVREVAKGAELTELDERARAWNASVDEDGTLRLRSAAEPREQAAQEA